MAFHETKKNNGYHSLFIKLFGHVWGGAYFSGHGVYQDWKQIKYGQLSYYVMVLHTLQQTL